MAESVDALVSNTNDSNVVPVRPRLRVHREKSPDLMSKIGRFFYCVQAPRGDVDRAGGSEILRRLEDVAFLTVVERDLLHVVQREAAQVDLAVLGVAQLDAVVEYGHVVGAHRTDVDGLQTAHAAVILELHACEVADGVGHREAVQALQVDLLEHLRGDDLAVFGDDGRAENDDFPDLLDAVQFAGTVPDRGGVRSAGRGGSTPSRNECEAQERKADLLHDAFGINGSFGKTIDSTAAMQRNRMKSLHACCRFGPVLRRLRNQSVMQGRSSDSFRRRRLPGCTPVAEDCRNLTYPFPDRNLQQRELLPTFTAFPFDRPETACGLLSNLCAAKI